MTTRRYLMKKAFIGGRFFNRISQMPVLKKWMMGDIITVLPSPFLVPGGHSRMMKMITTNEFHEW